MIERPARIGGHILADALVGHGITHAFCVPGESFLPVLDGLYAVQDRITLVTCRFEAGAVNMAEAVGKLTGRPAAAFVTRGPGACHGAVGVHIAHQDSTPLLLFVGQIPHAETDRESFQEIDYRRMFGSLAKWVTQIDEADRIPELFAHAVDVATSGRPGPVVIALSEEMQIAHQHRRPTSCPPRYSSRNPTRPASSSCAQCWPRRSAHSSSWAAAAGASRAGRRSALSSTRICRSPSRSAARRCTTEHANICGGSRRRFGPGLVAAVRDADLVLAIGARLSEATTQGYTLFDPPCAARLVHVYPDAAEIGRVFRPALGIACAPNAFAHALAALNMPADPPWRDWTRRLRARRLLRPKYPIIPAR